MKTKVSYAVLCPFCDKTFQYRCRKTGTEYKEGKPSAEWLECINEYCEHYGDRYEIIYADVTPYTPKPAGSGS